MVTSTLHFPPAKHGDAFFIHCYKGNENGIIVVDGGPIQSRNFIVDKIEGLPQIDLMILTHHDDDHIEGILNFIRKHRSDVPFPVQKLWVNCARHIDLPISTDLTADQANKLADTLTSISKKTSIKWMEYIAEGYNASDISFADIEVISPTENILTKYIAEYEKRNHIQSSVSAVDLSSKRGENDLGIDLLTLSIRKKKMPNPENYNELVNMASIAFILRCDGLSILMLGDSFPQNIEAYLQNKGYSKKHKLEVDFVKVSHHGSHNNISNDLLDMIKCNNYIISTNGGQGKSNHPDRETIANILCHPERNMAESIHLYFNYELSFIQQNGNILFNEGELAHFNCIIHEPDENTVKNDYRIITS